MIARTGAELWYELIEIAGLQPETSYDRDIVNQVGRALELGWGSDLGEEIERSGKDATAVLVAVLGALQPWAEMMRDLLELMADCGATTTRTQLRAEVDVGAASEQLDLDLSQFTEAIEELETVAAAVVEWSVDDLNQLWRVLPAVSEDEYVRLRREVQRWLAAYLPEASQASTPEAPWPLPPPPAPRCGEPEVDQALAAAWSVWESLLRRAAAGSASRLDLRRRAWEMRAAEDDPEGSPTLAWIAIADSDHFFAFVAAGLDEIARRVRSGAWSEWGTYDPRHSPQDLIDLVKRVGSEAKGEEVARQVRHLLSLPAWKHRYDLYSNWVFTRIVAALREVTEVRVEHTEGRIDFGFAEAKMATSEAHDLAVYCELRSPLLGPSRKRTQGVQPDYSILIGGAEVPAKTSVLEVECKQYKSASRENFAAALQDYARARPQAKVVLANYGPVSARVRSGILTEVEEGLRDRCQVIGEMRPAGPGLDADGPRHEFATAVRKGVGIEPPPGLLTLPDGPARIDLSWSDPTGGADLDLHLEIEDGGVVYFGRTKAGEPPHARLVEDVLSGGGPETMMVERWLDSTYRLWVHHYGNAELNGCEPVVVLSCKELQRTFECPAGGGPWWCVFEVDGATKELRPVNGREVPPGTPRE